MNTKLNYTLIKPENALLDANLAEELRQNVEESFETGQPNVILNLNHCVSIEKGAANVLLDTHQFVYDHGGSMVLTMLNEEVLNTMKKEQFHLTLNITPTLIEAVDIISMEILERDLYNES